MFLCLCLQCWSCWPDCWCFLWGSPHHFSSTTASPPVSSVWVTAAWGGATCWPSRARRWPSSVRSCPTTQTWHSGKTKTGTGRPLPLCPSYSHRGPASLVTEERSRNFLLSSPSDDEENFLKCDCVWTAHRQTETWRRFKTNFFYMITDSCKIKPKYELRRNSGRYPGSVKVFLLICPQGPSHNLMCSWLNS